MARRHRAVERASRRRDFLDRILVGVLVVVAASGLMSVLPAQAQGAVSRFACRVGTLGLGACGADPLDLGNPELNPPRCGVLAALDTVLPEVRVTDRVTAEGLAFQIRSSRSGDSVLRLGPTDNATPPAPLTGETRANREVLPGVTVPVQTEWFLPGGQGADVVVRSAQEQHRQWVQRRSSLAVLSTVFGDQGRDIPAPTVALSQVRLDVPVLPRARGGGVARPAPPQSGSYLAVRPSQPALLQFNRMTRESSLVIGLRGVVGRTPVEGAMRWTRDPAGTVTSVIIGLVSAGRLASGEPRTAAGTTGVAYLSVPVKTAAERTLVEAWLSDGRGFRVGLDELLGLRSPDPRNQLASFLTRAATVTILRYAGTDPTRAAQLVRSELTLRQRVAWPGAKLQAASAIAPQPNRTRRAVAADPSCKAP